ncbi:MAG: GNAT family N-acetyltransferase [Pseudomonadota bacterium]
MELPETLETERLTLRPLRASDAGPMSLYAGDRRVAEMLENVPHPYPPGAAEAYIERCASGAGDELVWALDATKIDGAEFLGVISLRPDDEPRVMRVGYWVGPPFWRTGYAREAAVAVVDAAQRAGVAAIVARIFAGNEASAQVLRAAGLAEVGRGETFGVASGRLRTDRRFHLAFALAGA